MPDRLIAKLECFAPLSRTAAGAVRKAVSPGQIVAAKHDLVREGDRPGSALAMLDGWACRYRILPNGTRQVLSYLMPGDVFDPHAGFVTEMDHGVQTITRTVVADVDTARFDAAVARHPDLARAVRLSELADEASGRAWITSMGRRSSMERVAHLLCELYLRAQTTGLAMGEPFTLPLSQLLLADSLGMTPVHINRVFRALRRIGALESQRGSLALVDVAVLANVAGFYGGYLDKRLRRAA